MSDVNVKQVRAIYMEDSRNRHRAVITKVGSGEINKKFYQWIQLSETIFHPKGGGQPSDEGTIDGIPVAYVHKEYTDKNQMDRYVIYHCFASHHPLHFTSGDEVELVVEQASRLLNSRLHTAGHLLAEAVNKCYPEFVAYQGNHYPESSYVKFKIVTSRFEEDKEKIKQNAAAQFNSWIDQNPEVVDRLDQSGIRTVKVVELWTPCGGTHVKNLKEIGQLSISDLSFNKKEGTLTIKYCFIS